MSFDITTRLRYMIKSIDGNSDVSTINKFVFFNYSIVKWFCQVIDFYKITT